MRRFCAVGRGAIVIIFTILTSATLTQSLGCLEREKAKGGRGGGREREEERERERERERGREGGGGR